MSVIAPSLCSDPSISPAPVPIHHIKTKAKHRFGRDKKNYKGNEELVYRFRSSSAAGRGLRDVEPRLPANMLRQLPVWLVLRGRVGLGEAMPCSRSSSSSSSTMVRGIGSAEDEELLTDSAAWT